MQRATVVVPTCGRPDGLVRLLDGLARQADPGVAWDVIVVDNNAGQDASRRTSEAFARAAPALPVAARLVREKRSGVSHARNRGIREAGGTLVVFLDDDVVPDHDWLHELLAPILAGRCTGTGGRVVLDPRAPRPPWFAAWMEPYFAAFEPSDREADVRDLTHATGRPFVLTSSLALRRDLLHAIGGFDPRFGPRGGAPYMCEDIDLCLRYQDAGGTIRFVPSAVVVHDFPAGRMSRSFLVRRWYWHGRSTWLLDEEAFRTAKFLGVRSHPRAVLAAWRKARASHEPRIGLRVMTEAAYRAGMLDEGLRHLRRGLRGWRTGAPPRRTSFDEDAEYLREVTG